MSYPMIVLAAFFAFSPAALAAGCQPWEAAVERLRSPVFDAEARSGLGRCLLKSHLEQPEVAATALRIIRDPDEDILLREDLIEAFAEASLRKEVRVEHALAPAVTQQERAAVGRTLASAQSLLEVTQAVKSMRETVPVTRFEADFFRALSEISLDDRSHVELRSVAVASLEKAVKQVVASGVYDEQSLRVARDALAVVASRDDSASYYSGAGPAYARLASAGLPQFAAPALGRGGRMLSSEKRP